LSKNNFFNHGLFRLKTIIPFLVIAGGIVFSYSQLSTRVDMIEGDQKQMVRKGQTASISDVEVLKAKMENIEEDIDEMKGNLKEVQKDIKILLRSSQRNLNDRSGG
jgi:TolA-binding protein